MNLKPCNSYIYIQLHENKSTDAAIVIPDTVQSPTIPYAEVLAVADDVTCCKPGDRVLLRPGCNILGVDDAERKGLLSVTAVLAIILDPVLSVG